MSKELTFCVPGPDVGLWTTREAAAELGKTDRQVRYAIGLGICWGIRIGNYTVVDANGLADLRRHFMQPADHQRVAELAIEHLRIVAADDGEG